MTLSLKSLKQCLVHQPTLQHYQTHRAPPGPMSRIALLMLLFGAGAQLVLRIAASLSRHDTKQASFIICLSLLVYRIASCFWTERLSVYAVIKSSIYIQDVIKSSILNPVYAVIKVPTC